MEEKRTWFQYKYSYKGSRGQTVNVTCCHCYATRSECDEALSDELSKLERLGTEHFGGEIIERND